MRKFIISAAIITGLTALSAFASAGDAKDDVSTVSIRQNNRSLMTKIDGLLSCTMAGNNEGQPCDLKFQANNGRSFEIASSRELMRLYNDGIRKVSLEGTPGANDAFEIKSVTARSD